jgi:hypothetical protein
MTLPQHILALSKTEQRVVILIVLLLLGGAVAKYYRAQSLGRPPATIQSIAAPSSSPLDEEQPAPNDH